MTDRELMQQALDALEKLNKDGWILADFEDEVYAAIKALRARLSKPDCACDSPAWCKQYNKCHRAVVGLEPYAAPPQREWQGLTDEEVKDVVLDNPSTSYELFGLIRDDVTVLLFRRAISDFIRAIEAKLKEKNT